MYFLCENINLSEIFIEKYIDLISIIKISIGSFFKNTNVI